MRKLFTLLLLCCAGQMLLGQVQQVRDIYTGADNSHPENLFQYRDFLIFAAESADEGTELWMSDGTEEGTVLLKDINPGQASSNPAEFIEFQNFVYFSATTADEGRELWVTDGTEAGTQLVMDINAGAANSSPHDFEVFQDLLWFTATTPDEGAELWNSDGTAAGTSLFMDINEGSGISNPDHKFAAEFTDFLYFSAQTDSTGNEVWITDGTISGTRIVKDISEGAASSNPQSFIEVDGSINFTAETDSTGRELYITEGMSSNTRMIKDLYPGSLGSDPRDLTAIGIPFFTGQVLFYIGKEDTTGDRLYAYLASADTIFEYVNLNQGASMEPAELGDLANLALHFSAYFTIPGPNGPDTIGRELFLIDVFGFLSDTAEAGEVTVMTLINENDATFSDVNFDFLDGYMYYSVQTERFGKELYRTPFLRNFLFHERLSDINPRDGDSRVDDITVIGKHIFFEATDGVTGNELYAYVAELGEVEVLALPTRQQVLPGDTLDLGIVESNLDTILIFEFGRATTPAVRVERVNIEGDGYFVTPIMPATFLREGFGAEERDSFYVNYVATEEGSIDVGTVYLENDYAVLDTFTFYIKAEVEMDVATRSPYAEGWKLAPNPVLNEVQLSGPAVETKGQLRVLNARGDVIREMSIEKFETDRKIYLENMPSGQYYIHMTDKEGRSTVMPFIKG